MEVKYFFDDSDKLDLDENDIEVPPRDAIIGVEIILTKSVNVLILGH